MRMILMIREGARVGSAGGRPAATRHPLPSKARESHEEDGAPGTFTHHGGFFAPRPLKHRAMARRRNTFSQLIWSYFRSEYEK